VQAAQGDGLRLTMVSNRGQKVWPQGATETFCTDHWRCRFQVDDDKPAINQAQVFELLRRVDALGLTVIKTEHLYTFDGERGYTLGQGQ
jgi:isocitrate dehydrogenase